MKRLLALVAAAAMVLGALQVRARFDGGGDGGAEDPLRLTCAAELAGACRSLEARSGGELRVRIEHVGITEQQLTAADSQPVTMGLDGWLAPAPWPAIVDEARQRAGLPPVFAPTTPPLARSPLVMAIWRERADTLAASCAGGRVGWRCVGDAAPRTWAALGGPARWGPVKPGHADPAVTAEGLLVLAQAAGDYFGRTAFSARDLEDDGFLTWLTGLERAVPSLDPAAGSPLEQMLQVGPARFDVVGAVEAHAGPLLERSASRRGSLALHYPDPLVTADVVLAPLTASARQDRLRELVGGAQGAAALAESGWRVQGRPLAAGVPAQPALPATPAGPSAGSLAALRAVWQEVTG